MTAKEMFIFALIVIFARWAYYVFEIFNFQYVPAISESDCWGAKEKCAKDAKIHPFHLNVQNREIKDLLYALKSARSFTPPLKNSQTQYGLSGRVIEELLRFIKEDYNFTQRQAFLNSFPQYTTNIQGLDVHFIHVKSKSNGSLPIVPIMLLHGWPSSVREFYESIPMLMSNEYQNKFTVELVIPSLSGFGYSDGSSKPGFHVAQVANLMKLLMNRLGYEKFIVHGSDWGAVTVTALATLFPNSVIGLHSNFCFSLRTVTFAKLFLGALWPRVVVEQKYEEKMYPLFVRFIRFCFAESGYLHLMGTKPDTIGHVLENTPVGLITFVFEKLSVGRNKSNIYSSTAGLEEFDLTAIVDTMMFYYWFPKKALTASRFYSENVSLDGLLAGLHNVPINKSVPCACAFFENEFLYQPENFLRDKFQNIIQYNIYPSIGHFAAIEANEVLTKDIIYFIGKLSDLKLLSFP